MQFAAPGQCLQKENRFRSMAFSTMLQNPKNMVSPLTGGTVTLNWEWREIEFRKEKFIVMTPYYVCDDTKEQFTTTESDTIWMNQLHNQYCAKHGIPYSDRIIDLRLF